MDPFARLLRSSSG